MADNRRTNDGLHNSATSPGDVGSDANVRQPEQPTSSPGDGQPSQTASRTAAEQKQGQESVQEQEQEQSAQFLTAGGDIGSRQLDNQQSAEHVQPSSQHAQPPPSGAHTSSPTHQPPPGQPSGGGQEHGNDQLDNQQSAEHVQPSSQHAQPPPSGAHTSSPTHQPPPGQPSGGGQEHGNDQRCGVGDDSLTATAFLPRASSTPRRTDHGNITHRAGDMKVMRSKDRIDPSNGSISQPILESESGTEDDLLTLLQEIKNKEEELKELQQKYNHCKSSKQQSTKLNLTNRLEADSTAGQETSRVSSYGNKDSHKTLSRASEDSGFSGSLRTGNLLWDFARCCVCTEVKASLKLLACFHVLCDDCNTRNTGCRQCELSSTDCGQREKVNSFIEVIFQIAFEADQKFTTPDEQTKCICDKTISSTNGYYCADCAQNLCQSCVEVHQKLPATKMHHVASATESFPFLIHATCSVHRTKMLEYFCETCNQFTCTLCCVNNGDHYSHTCVDVTVKAETCGEGELKRRVRTLKQLIEESEKRAEELNAARTDWKDNAEKIADQIQNELHETKLRLEDAANKLVRKLDELSDESQEKFKGMFDATKRKVVLLENLLKLMEKVKSSCSSREVVHFCRKLEGREIDLPTDIVDDISPKAIQMITTFIERYLPKNFDFIGRILLDDQRDDDSDSLSSRTWESISSQLREKDQEIEKLNRDLASLLQDIKCETAEKQQLELKLNSVTQEAFDTKRKAEEFHQQLTALHQQQTKAAKLFQDQQKAAERQKEVERAVTELRLTIQQQATTLSQLQAELSQKNQALEDMNEMICNLLDEKTTLEQISKCSQNELLDKVKTVADLETSLMRSQNLVDCSKQNNERTEIALQASIAENNELKATSLHYQEQLRTSARSDQILREQIDTLNSQVTEYIDRHDQLQTLMDNLMRESLPPVAVRVAELGNSPNRSPAYGITTLDNDIYVIRMSSSHIEVYSSDTFEILHNISVPGIIDAVDMTSCKRNRCIYLADAKNGIVHRVNLRQGHSQRYFVVYDKPYGLSVTSLDCHVLVTFKEVNKLKLFTSEGQLIQQIVLEHSVIHPRHAIQLHNGLFAVCHGDRSDSNKRVCLVTDDGKRVVSSFSPNIDGEIDDGIPLRWPTHLAVDVQYGNIFVTDYYNDRVVILNKDLVQVGVVGNDSTRIPNNLQSPLTMCLDIDNHRLYVGESGHRVSVFAMHRQFRNVQFD